ncbi:sensor histidine kinase [Sulfitobacter geojensis]|uniref:sensor histidine kinase n=1 Tax=Sulfitobacter geojensis TaxID=1342299 RepID=UPI000468E466|nr:HAMP domain-containing sensor histidine kinase [Sulfitobacter geojensis]KHA53457.1 Sensory box histidine kinase [Sulfitobacter geojensis]NYI27896.1 signal transduction histidine kinase [Sulfitobacter geojensis]
MISHDVRASVRALLELPRWIEEDLEEAGVKIDGSVAASIELMNRHTGRLDRMLVDLLTFSRIGRMQEVRENHLPRVLDQVLEDIPVPAGFAVIRDMECDQLVMGDRDVLTLFDALVGNALKHHDKSSGQIVISTSVQAGEVVLSVADDGPGIPPEYRENVFGAMRTLRPRDEVEGSGMGLANVRKIATLYGGSARITDSPYGRGTLVEARVGVN